MASIGNLVVTIAANAKPLVVGVNAAIAAVTRFRALATGVAAVATGAIVKSAIAIGSALQDMSDRVGVSVEALGALKFAAEQTDASFESLGNAFKFQAKFLFAAASGSKDATDTLARLGLSLRQLQAMNPEERFKAFADALSRIPDIGTRTAVAMKIFGRNTLELMPLINEGADGIARLEQSARGLGLLTGEEASKLEQLGDSFAALWTMISTNSAKVVAQFAQPMMDGINLVVGRLQDMGVIIGTTFAYMQTQSAAVWTDIGTVAVGNLKWIWETAKTITQNVLIAFQNLGKMIDNALTPIFRSMTEKFIKMTGFMEGKTAQQQNIIKGMVDRIIGDKGGPQKLQPFQALPEFQMPAQIPGLSGLAEALEDALAKDRASRVAIGNIPKPGEGPGFDFDGAGQGGKSARQEQLGAVQAGSAEAYRLIGDILGAKKDPVAAAVAEADHNIVAAVGQLGGIMAGIGVGAIVPSFLP